MPSIIRLALAALLLLSFSGCASLLERSYSVVEPYAVRYWDSSGEDTLRAENYQDLVNSLLMLVEQRSEEGVIRCYGEAGDYTRARAACREVQGDTMLGSYLLEDLSFTYSTGTGCSTMTLQITYRADAEDPESIMTLSDSQSLVDLLRIDVREGHERLTARFVYDTSRAEVSAAMDAFWRELCQGGPDKEPGEKPELQETQEHLPEEDPAEDSGENLPPEEGAPEPLSEDGDESPEGEASSEDPELPPEEEPVAYPPCPWTARYYPDQDTAGIVEILLDPAGTARALEQVQSEQEK